jgi:hypothetical protein
MNSRTLAALSVGSLAVVVAALVYLNSDTASLVPPSTGVASPAISAEQSARTAMVRKLEPGELLGSSEIVEPKKPIPQIEKVDPKKYSTGAKPDSHEAKIFKLVLELETSDAEKVNRLLAMIPQLPPEPKLVALEHAAQLIPDEDYVRLRPSLLRLANTDELREVVMLDVLTRDDTIKMPGLVELMKLPHDLVKTEAREVLEAYLEEDYGDDPKQWETAVRRWLAENADI